MFPRAMFPRPNLAVPELLLVTLLAGAAPAATPPTGLVKEREVSLLVEQGRPLSRNVLKLFRAVADPEANRVYVAGIMTSTIGILEGDGETWVGTLESGIEGNALKYLAVDPGRGRLYVFASERRELRMIDVRTGAITGPVAFDGFMGAIQVDTRRGLLCVATPEAPHFRILDGGTLATVFTTDELGSGIGAGDLDAESDRLYLLDGQRAGPQGRAVVFDLGTRTVASTISLTLPAGARPSRLFRDRSGRLVVAVPGRQISILSSTGAEVRAIPLPRDLELQDAILDAGNGQVVALFLNPPATGEVVATDGLLRAWDVATGALVAETAFGTKPHSLALNTATGKIYVPNGDASLLWSVATDRKGATGLRLGDSVEQVVPALGGKLVVMNSRLGGSYLAAWDVESGRLSTFTAGTWPIPIRTTSDGKTLVALNAWDSTLSVFGLGDTVDAVRTVPLGIPAGTTDRIPELAVDSRTSRAWAVYPELATLSVVDFATGQPVATLELSGVTPGDTGGGPGQVQVLVNEAAGRAFVLVRDRARLSVLEAAGTPRLLSEITLPAGVSAADAPSIGLLFLDAARSRLYAGALELDAQTGQPTGRRLGRGQRVFAVDEANGLLWAHGLERPDGAGGTLRSVVSALDRDSLASLFAADLGAVATIVPEVALDGGRGVLYQGLMTSASLEIWRVERRRPVSGGGGLSGLGRR